MSLARDAQMRAQPRALAKVEDRLYVAEMNEIRRSYHEELEALQGELVRMAGLVTENILRGTTAFLDEDLKAIEDLIGSDKGIDAICHDIEERTYALMAMQQPMAGDLRALVSMLRIIHEIERSGDLMVNIAKMGRKLYSQEIDPKLRGIIRDMGNQAHRTFASAIEAFVDRDTDKAKALEEMDDVIDDYQRDLLRQILVAGEEHLEVSVRVALVGRFYERIADHAVNIGERVIYTVTGEIPGVPLGGDN